MRREGQGLGEGEWEKSCHSEDEALCLLQKWTGSAFHAQRPCSPTGSLSLFREISVLGEYSGNDVGDINDVGLQVKHLQVAPVYISWGTKKWISDWILIISVHSLSHVRLFATP